MNTTDPAASPGSGRMFDAIAHRYDLLNRVLSLGTDQSWRRRTVKALRIAPGHRVLDLATGTADLALLIARTHGDCTVTGVDPSEGMLAVGRRKVTEAGLDDRITLLAGDAQSLDAADGSFDRVCIAFGIRNVPDRVRALREMRRVLRPGGRVAILELSEPREGWTAPFARFHVHHVVPTLGAWLSGAQEYRYLQRSIAAFPPAAEFAASLRDAGFVNVDATPILFGVSHLYVGDVPAAET